MRDRILTVLIVMFTVLVGSFFESQSVNAETYQFNIGPNDIKNAFEQLMNGDKPNKKIENRKRQRQIRRSSQHTTQGSSLHRASQRSSQQHRARHSSSRHRNKPTHALHVSTKIPASWKVEEKIVGPAPDTDTIYWLSPKGMHLAAIYMEGSRFVVSIDGVKGKKFNEILHAATGVVVKDNLDGIARRRSERLNKILHSVALARRQRETWRGPVAFSPDGSRYAYAARLGKEAVVILDGKEIFRDVYKKAMPPLIRDSVSMLSFTPDGKHLLFYADTGRLMMDGQPVTPELKGMPWPFFSADGSHWGLLAEPVRPFNAWSGSTEGGAFMTLIGKYIQQSEEAYRETIFIDGKEVDYNCQYPRFTLDGKHVVCTQRDNAKQSVLVDGVSLMTVNSMNDLVLSPNGDIAVIASGKGGKQHLYINGKMVPGGEDAWSVTFSPDGRRWAAVCKSNPLVWVVVDGHKQLDYDNVSDVKFSPDSSTFIYIATTGKKKFVVINEEEDHGAPSVRIRPMFGATGHDVSYVVSEGWNKMKVYHAGKAPIKSRQVSEFTVSPDGMHYAFNGALDALSGRLIVDGEVKGRSYAQNNKILFSPDSQHIATISKPLTRSRRRSIYRDGRFAPFYKGMDYPSVLGFTLDSKHLLVKWRENTKKGSDEAYFLDGKSVATFHLNGMHSGLSQHNRELPLLSKLWEMQPDGGVVLIGHEPGDQNSRGVVKRIKILPEGSSQNLLIGKREE